MQNDSIIEIEKVGEDELDEEYDYWVHLEWLKTGYHSIIVKDLSN